MHRIPLEGIAKNLTIAVSLEDAVYPFVPFDFFWYHVHVLMIITINKTSKINKIVI